MQSSTNWGWVIWAPALAGLLVASHGCTQLSRSGESASRASTATSASSEESEDQSEESDETAPEEIADEQPREGITIGGTPSDDAQPQTREVAKPVVGEYAANVPAVLLSAAHSKLCKVNVGDAFPAFELPKLDGGSASLESLLGAKATVVVFWTNDRWMSKTALQDLAQVTGDGVSIVGVTVGVKGDVAEKLVADSGAKVPQLLDEQGTAFDQVGTGALPRLYVLDGDRRIAWFDIEYSEATRRELKQTLAALTEAAQ
jgi:peroxiredoxin